MGLMTSFHMMVNADMHWERPKQTTLEAGQTKVLKKMMEHGDGAPEQRRAQQTSCPSSRSCTQTLWESGPQHSSLQYAVPDGQQCEFSMESVKHVPAQHPESPHRLIDPAGPAHRVCRLESLAWACETCRMRAHFPV